MPRICFYIYSVLYALVSSGTSHHKHWRRCFPILLFRFQKFPTSKKRWLIQYVICWDQSRLEQCIKRFGIKGNAVYNKHCWDRPSALAGIDRRLWEALGRSTSHSKQKKKMNSSRDKSCAKTQQRTHVALCVSLHLFYNDEYRVFL
jgi:hypothetical protein